MASERIQRRIDRLLDEIEQAADQEDWSLVERRSREVLSLDDGNQDANAFLASARSMIGPGRSGPA